MTQEEKAKAYDEAVKRAKAAIDVAADKDLVGGVVKTILPELRESESEDERVRKALINLVCTVGEYYLPKLEARNKMLDYLEKQKEQKPEWSEEDENIIKNHESSKDTILKRLKSLRPQSKDEIYKEKDEAFKLGKHQLAIKFMNYLDENRPEGKMSLSNGECEDIDKAFKENDWAKIIRYAEKYLFHWKSNEEDEKDIAHIIEILDDCYAFGRHDLSKTEHENLVNKLKSLRPQPKQEWSEEDERLYKCVLKTLELWAEGKLYQYIIPSNTDRYIDFFKSLKFRVQPQPKQEWSEEDEILRVRTINRLETLNFHGISGIEIRESIDWLKSLCPSWKPSEEQMKALEECGECKRCIKELYEQLNKR